VGLNLHSTQESIYSGAATIRSRRLVAIGDRQLLHRPAREKGYRGAIYCKYLDGSYQHPSLRPNCLKIYYHGVVNNIQYDIKISLSSNINFASRAYLLLIN